MNHSLTLAARISEIHCTPRRGRYHRWDATDQSAPRVYLRRPPGDQHHELLRPPDPPGGPGEDQGRLETVGHRAGLARHRLHRAVRPGRLAAGPLGGPVAAEVD